MFPEKYQNGSCVCELYLGKLLKFDLLKYSYIIYVESSNRFINYLPFCFFLLQPLIEFVEHL